MVLKRGFPALVAHQNCLRVFNDPHAQTAPLTNDIATSGSGVWAVEWQPLGVLSLPRDFRGQVENHFAHVTEIWGNESTLHQHTKLQTHLSTCFVQDTPRDHEMGESQQLEASTGNKPVGKEVTVAGSKGQ